MYNVFFLLLFKLSFLWFVMAFPLKFQPDVLTSTSRSHISDAMKVDTFQCLPCTDMLQNQTSGGVIFVQCDVSLDPLTKAGITVNFNWLDQGPYSLTF